jgi:hypothetical protein
MIAIYCSLLPILLTYCMAIRVGIHCSLLPILLTCCKTLRPACFKCCNLVIWLDSVQTRPVHSLYCANLVIWPDSVQTRPVPSLCCTAVVFHLMWWVYFPNHVFHFGCQCWAQLLYSKVCQSPQRSMLYNLCSLHGLFILQSELSRVQFEAKMCQGVSATRLFMFVIGVPCTVSLCAMYSIFLVCHVLLSLGLTCKCSLQMWLYRVKAPDYTVVFLSWIFIFGVIVQECNVA